MEHLKGKYGEAAVAQFSAPGNPLDVAGEKVGITFDQSRRVIRTTACHQVMEFLKTKEDKAHLQDAFMDKMFYAYFTEAKDLSDANELLQVAQDAGLDRAECEGVISSDQFVDVIARKDGGFKRGGVSGVPFFILGGYKFSGAQPKETFLEILEEMQEAM